MQTRAHCLCTRVAIVAARGEECVLVDGSSAQSIARARILVSAQFLPGALGEADAHIENIYAAADAIANLSRERVSFVKRRWVEHLAVLGAYTLLALLLTWPLVLHFANTIPGVTGDVWSYVWAMGWARTSLDLGVNPFRTDYVFYPLVARHNCFGPLRCPASFQFLCNSHLGLILAFNLMYLAATVLTAYGNTCWQNTYSRTDKVRKAERHDCIFVAGCAFCILPRCVSAMPCIHKSVSHGTDSVLHLFFAQVATRASATASSRYPTWTETRTLIFKIAAFLIMFTALWFVSF